MPVTNDKYDQLKIDKLKHFLQEMAAKGQPRPFEIFVDNLKMRTQKKSAYSFIIPLILLATINTAFMCSRINRKNL
jgi:hypothetical protein